MPIKDLQRRLREAGRIRLGEQLTAANGSKRPTSLGVFRLTSADRQAIEMAAEAFGGDVQSWPDAPSGSQWQVTTTSQVLDVLVPPGDLAFSQWRELWSGGGCQRRCDGVTELLSDSPCLCDPDPARRECHPTTRLSLLIPAIRGLGVWRLETHGWNAATELAGVVEVAAQAAEGGRFIPARLRIEQRTVKRVKKGRPQTQHFVVPVLDLDVSLHELLGQAVAEPRPELAAPPPVMVEEPPAIPSSTFTPVPEPSGRLKGKPIAEQVAALAELQRKGRRKSTPLVPATGIDVTIEDQVEDKSEDKTEDKTGPDPEAWRRKVMAQAREAWGHLGEDTNTNYRHTLGVIATAKTRRDNPSDGPPWTHSVNDMTVEERSALSRLLDEVLAARMHVSYEDPENHTVIVADIVGSGRRAVVTQTGPVAYELDVQGGET